MVKQRKGFLILAIAILAIIVLGIAVSAFSLNPFDWFKKDVRLAVGDCSDDQTIMKLSAETNAHAEAYSPTGTYPIEICYDEIFGTSYAGATPHDCTADFSNMVAILSGTTNAHIPSLSNPTVSLAPKTAEDVAEREIPCGSYGDADGDGFITDNDIYYITYYPLLGGLAGLNAWLEENGYPPMILENGDVNGDGDVTSLDGQLIYQYLNEIDDTFPVCETTTCTNGNTQACTTDGCAGTQTCTNEAWGNCIKTDSNCDVITCAPGQKIGDADGNGILEIKDVILIVQVVEGLSSPPIDICCLDVDGDGVITNGDDQTPGDAQLIRDVLVGTIPADFGVCETTLPTNYIPVCYGDLECTECSDVVGDSTFKFIVSISSAENAHFSNILGSYTTNLCCKSPSASGTCTRPSTLTIDSPSDDNIFRTGEAINFVQTSDSCNDFSITWDFEETPPTPDVSKVKPNCLTANCDATHTFTTAGYHNVIATAKDSVSGAILTDTTGATLTDSIRILVLAPKVNMIPNITEPRRGTPITGGRVDFDGTTSYANWCYDNDEASCTAKTADLSGISCYQVPNAVDILSQPTVTPLFCYNYPNPAQPLFDLFDEKYNMFLKWTVWKKVYDTDGITLLDPVIEKTIPATTPPASSGPFGAWTILDPQYVEFFQTLPSNEEYIIDLDAEYRGEVDYPLPLTVSP